MTTVYRVESPIVKNWNNDPFIYLGPYGEPEIRYPEWEEWYHFFLKNHGNSDSPSSSSHPALGRDFARGDASGRYWTPWAAEHYYSGFLSMKDAANWFDETASKLLDKAGFKLYKYESDDFAIGKSLKQILFKPVGERTEIGSVYQSLYGGENVNQ